MIGSLRSSNRPLAIAAQSLDRQRSVDRAGERSGEDPGRSLDGLRRRRFVASAELAGDRSRGDAGHPAGVDQGEVLEVDADVQGDAVVADATLDAEAECADLARLRTVEVAPAARVALATSRLDAEGAAGIDQRRLERADERSEQQAALVQADDRIRHELAGTVVGDLPATLDPFDRDAPAASSALVARMCAGSECLPSVRTAGCSRSSS